MRYDLPAQDQRIPADMILLRTTERNGSCFIRTDQLDGETDWKLRMAVPSTQTLPSDQVHATVQHRARQEACIYFHCSVEHGTSYVSCIHWTFSYTRGFHSLDFTFLEFVQSQRVCVC